MIRDRRSVLHVVHRLERGGIQTWLRDVWPHLGERFAMDLAVEDARPGALAPELEERGARIWHGGAPGRRGDFLRQLRASGPYDVVHSHVQARSGPVLRLAARAGVAVRVAHGHNDRSALRPGTLRRLHHRFLQHRVRRHATAGIACSRAAAADLFGARWESDRRWRVLPYGIDLTPFEAAATGRDELRAALGLSPDTLAVGHVGRFVRQKNHRFLIEVAAALGAGTVVLLIGDGPLRPGIEARARDAGVGDRVRFLGPRADVPRLMLEALDVLILPSLHEGLPLAAIEAQAAGLPALLSDRISAEIEAVPELVQRLPLGDPGVWAAAMRKIRERPLTRREALARVAGSRFDARRSAADLMAIYDELIESSTSR